jgi:hypothetical protein
MKPQGKKPDGFVDNGRATISEKCVSKYWDLECPDAVATRSCKYLTGPAQEIQSRNRRHLGITRL